MKVPFCELARLHHAPGVSASRDMPVQVFVEYYVISIDSILLKVLQPEFTCRGVSLLVYILPPGLVTSEADARTKADDLNPSVESHPYERVFTAGL